MPAEPAKDGRDVTFLTHLEDVTIERLVEGLLDEAEASAAKSHLEDCARCRRRSGEVSAMFTALSRASVRPEPPVDFLAAVMRKVDREPGLVVQPIRTRVVAGSLAAGLATAAAGAAMVWADGGPALPVAEVVTGLTAVLARADLVGALAKAVAPLAAGAALASTAVLAPFFIRALRTVPSRAARVPVRS